jgi:DNA polymerase-3 subunit delta
MRFQDGLTSLKFKRDSRFMLVGDEPYLKELFIKSAKSVYSGWELLDFYPDTEKEALSSLGSGGLFDGRLIVLHDFNKMDIKKFTDFVSSTQDCVIFVVTDGYEGSSRNMTTITSKSAVVECIKMKEYGNDYPLWVSSKISDGGFTKRDGVDSAIYSMVGPDMFSLSNEISKLFIYRNETKDISLDDVNSVISLTSTKSSFDILDCLLKKDIPGAIRCLDSYSRVQDNYIELVSFLSLYMEKVYRILLLRDEKMTPEDIADIVGIPRYILKTKYLSKAVALGKSFVSDKMDQLCKLDVQLRKFKGNKKILIENFIFKFS